MRAINGLIGNTESRIGRGRLATAFGLNAYTGHFASRGISKASGLYIENPTQQRRLLVADGRGIEHSVDSTEQAFWLRIELTT